MAALNTIDQSWLTHVHPNDPRNHCAQSLYPFSLGFMKWGIGKTFLKESIWRIKIYFVDGQANFTTTITTERINTRLVSHNWITRDKRPWQRLVSKERIFRSYLVRPCLRSALKQWRISLQTSWYKNSKVSWLNVSVTIPSTLQVQK